MTPFETYAAERSADLTIADDRLRLQVEAALAQYGTDGWYDPILNEAEIIFAEVYADEQGDRAGLEEALGAFNEAMSTFLAQSTAPSTPVDEAQVERITTWASTFTGNAAVAAASGPDDKMVWTSMRDGDVRDTHRVADGQVRTVGQTFDVGGAALRFPGDPLGPLHEVLGCRCLLLREGGTTMAGREFAGSTIEADAEAVPIEDMPLGEPSDYAFETPTWHGVIAPEGTPSGDGRSFAADSLTTRDLPLPLRWVRADFGEHGGAVVVGNILKVWRDGGLIKAEGDFRTDAPEANEVIGMIATDMLRGVSVDLDDIAFEVDPEENEIGEHSVTLTKGRVSAATLVDIPAFPEVFISLGRWDEGETATWALVAGCLPCERAAMLDGQPPLDEEPAEGEYPDWEVGEMVRVDAPSGEEVVATITAIDDATGIATVEPEGGGAFDVPLADLRPYEAEHEPEDMNGAHALAFRDYDADQRKAMAEKGEALPDGSFPIADEEDLRNAIQAIGRASDPAAAKAHIKKRASALGLSDLIPEDWAGDVEQFAASPEMIALMRERRAVATDPEEIALVDRYLATAAAGTKDGPGWLTNPEDTQRLRNYWTHGEGAAKIGWGTPGDFNRCRTQLGEYVNPLFLAGTCANLHKEALGVWPGRERGGVASDDTTPFNLVAAANRVYDHALFERPVLDTPEVGVRVEGDRVFGYIAQWGVCHIGVQGVCTEAPPSANDYWYYATGVVDTDQGEVRVGQITMDTGHADLSWNAPISVAHYDNTGSAVADITVGDDEFGIWFSGALRPEVTEAQRHALRAAGRLSGDWRRIGRGLEMVAALAVNVPGFPIPKVGIAASGGVQTALVAAGIQQAALVESADIKSLVREALGEIDAERERAHVVAQARATLRAARIERARAALRG